MSHRRHGLLVQKPSHEALEREAYVNFSQPHFYPRSFQAHRYAGSSKSGKVLVLVHSARKRGPSLQDKLDPMPHAGAGLTPLGLMKGSFAADARIWEIPVECMTWRPVLNAPLSAHVRSFGKSHAPFRGFRIDLDYLAALIRSSCTCSNLLQTLHRYVYLGSYGNKHDFCENCTRQICRVVEFHSTKSRGILFWFGGADARAMVADHHAGGAAEAGRSQM
jgi:hypothetical protein